MNWNAHKSIIDQFFLFAIYKLYTPYSSVEFLWAKNIGPVDRVVDAISTRDAAAAAVHWRALPSSKLRPDVCLRVRLGLSDRLEASGIFPLLGRCLPDISAANDINLSPCYGL